MQHERDVAMVPKDVSEPLPIANVYADNLHRALRSQPLHVLQRARSTEVIQHQYFFPVADEAASSIAAYETQSSSDENAHSTPLLSGLLDRANN
jgi:hypothetical protein